MEADYALAYVKENARTSEQQEALLGVLRTKCDILWAMLNSLHPAYVEPKMIPPARSCPAKGDQRDGKFRRSPPPPSQAVY